MQETKEPFNPLARFCIIVFSDGRPPECRRCDEPLDGGTFFMYAPKGMKEGAIDSETFNSLNPGE